MKTTFLLAGILAATLSRAGDSAPFRLDTRAGIRAARATEPLAYSTDWNSGATGVAIDLDGAPLFSAASQASGDYVWNTDGLPDGLHTLTFNDGVETLDAQFYINPGRIVFDANGGEETMPDFTLFPGAEQTLPESTFTKDGHFLLGWALTPDGEATLLDGDSTADIVAAQGETVTLYAVWHEGAGASGDLIHRWSFNGDLTDSVGNQNALAIGNVTDDGQSYRLAGGSNGASYIDLGSNVLPRDGSAATIEIWATRHSFKRWGRIFDFGTGSGDGDYVFMAWSGQYESDCPFRIYGIGGNVLGLEPYDSNREYHFAMVFEPGADGVWQITTYKQDAETGETLKVVTTSSGNSGWSLQNQGMNTCWLGHSRYSADLDANASYNEVRIWRAALNESELTANVLNGADANITSSYAVRFDANGGEGTMAKRVYVGGDDVTLPALAFTRDGWTFVGWATEPDGPVVYADCEAFEGGIDAANGATVTLYARWAQSQYAVHFNANGGVGAMPKRVYAAGEDAMLPATTFTRDGYTFVGWATSAEGPMAYGDGETVTGGFDVANGETITLYARWSTGTYTVHFDANGGMGAMPDQTLWLGVPQPLATNAFVREGFAFAGWAAAPDGQPVCEDGGDFNHTGETGDAVTLYAEWVLVPGLAVRYYDISTSGYAAWTQSESAMMDYFSAQTPTIETNTLAFGDSLDAGFTTLPDSSQQSKWRSSGLTILQAGSRFHGKYSIESTKGFSALIEGFLRIDVPGLYEFASVADDVVVFYIDGQLILENEETWVTAATGHTRLSTGLHSITIAFREQDQAGGQGISVQWRRSGESTYTPIPQSSLWHAPRGDESTDAAILWGAVDISSALGSPDPGGRFNAPWGAMVELSMSEPLVIDPDDSGVRQACVGWVGTGSVPATGSETNMSFVLRECSTVTWLWETNSVWVSFAVEGDAEAVGETEGWFALGTDAVLSFAPTSAVAVVCELSGDAVGVTVDAEARTVTIPADRPRSVTVHVRAMTPADSLETGEAGDWSGLGGGIEAAGGWHLAPDATAADGYSLRSDETAAGETATVELAVPLAGTLTFDWRVLTTARRHYARFYVDGVRQKQITGNTDWATETIALGDGAHILRWTYEKSNAATSGEDAAFLDNVHWTPLTLAAALDATNVVWATEGGAEWIPQVSVSSDSESAARSGSLVGEETSRLVATVRGKGTFSWFWKAEIDGIAGVDIYLDGEWLEDIWLDSDVVDWEEMSLDIVGDGTHEVVFAFWNGGGADDIGDCAYIDSVSWEPASIVATETSTTPEPVPYVWLDAEAATILSTCGGDYEAAGNAMAANGLNKVWECYVAGISPTNAAERFEAMIEIGADGKPVVTWTPDLNEGGKKEERVYVVEGQERLGDGWGPTNAASRFFRVKVAMPEE